MGDPLLLQPAGEASTGASTGVISRARDMFTEVLSRAGKSTKANTGFMGLLTDNKITLKNLLLSAVVVGLELLLSSKVFDCPMNNHKAYGTVFLLAPFCIVFFTNLVILGEVSKLTDRCCVKRYRRRGDCFARVIPNVIKAFFGPTVWLIASFSDTEYFVCAEVGQYIDKRNLTNDKEIKALEEKFADAKSTSHMLAWLFFSLLVIVTAIVMISSRCSFKDNELLEDLYVFERREAITALLTFRDRTRHLIKQDDVENGTTERTNTSDSGEASRTAGGGEESSSDPSGITSDNGDGGEGDDEAEDDKKDKGFCIKITGRFLGKDEEITLYPNGAPEQFGKKRVEKLFEDWSKKDDWHYLKVYEDFVEMYPRIVSGKPWETWISDSIAEDNVLKQDSPTE